MNMQLNGRRGRTGDRGLAAGIVYCRGEYTQRQHEARSRAFDAAAGR